MKWGDFKKAVEAQGVGDETDLSYIDWESERGDDEEGNQLPPRVVVYLYDEPGDGTKAAFIR